MQTSLPSIAAHVPGSIRPSPPTRGAEVVTRDGRSLPLVSARLRAEAQGGIARVVLEQRFENRYAETLHVTYRMPLPADGAATGYAFDIADRTITGRIDRKRAARAQFEHAVASGKTAALFEQDRADIFTQSIGNLPAGEALIARITLDHKLVWLPEGEWDAERAARRIIDRTRMPILTNVSVAGSALIEQAPELLPMCSRARRWSPPSGCGPASWWSAASSPTARGSTGSRSSRAARAPATRRSPSLDDAPEPPPSRAAPPPPSRTESPRPRLVMASRAAETVPPPRVADEVSATERDTKPYPVAEPADEDILSRYRDDSSVRASIARLRTLVKDEQAEQRSRESLESSARPRTVPGSSAPEGEPARRSPRRAREQRSGLARESARPEAPRSVRASPMALVVWLVLIALVIAAALWWFVR